MNKASSISILTDLLHRHEEAAQKYREAVETVSERGLKDYLSSLAEYRKELYQEVRQWLEDMPPSPAPLSNRVRSYLYDNRDDFQEALLSDNRAQIADICKKSEEAISKYYKDALDQKGIPMTLYNDLQNQHQRVLDTIRKADRMDKVPMQRNNSF